MSALRSSLAAAVNAGAASLPAWKRLLEWYSMKLITNPVKTKGFTSMLVNPIGGMVGQIAKDGKVTNWKEIKYFTIWGLGLGALEPRCTIFCALVRSRVNNAHRPLGALLERAVAVLDRQAQMESSCETTR